LTDFQKNNQNIKFNEKSVQWELSCSPWAADRPHEVNSRILQFGEIYLHCLSELTNEQQS